jgi:ABC-type transport system substrate-binding protein
MSLRSLSIFLALAILATACARAERGGQSSSLQERTGPPKRVTAVVEGEHPLVISKLDKAFPGAEAIEVAVASGFVIANGENVLTPLLAEAVPSTDNGLWKINADGTMQTTWNLKKNAAWHDGTPLTAEDVLLPTRLARTETCHSFATRATG